MFYYVLCVLIITLLCVRYFLNSNKSNSNVNEGLYKLQFRYFIVFMPATFADWLQGPYLYKLYSLYGFRDDEIYLLYFAGFAASVSFGTCISCLADYIGRKKMCIAFNFIYMIACLTKFSRRFDVLLIGRICGGIGTSILFSVFEAWYIYQHVEKHQFPFSWISLTFSKSTYYNGLLAIIAGLISNVFAEYLQMGPISPFVLAIPCLFMSAIFTVYYWEEADVTQSSCFVSLKVARQSVGKLMILLCLIQSVFESVMYIFIIMWTPILTSSSPPLGIVFSCFMLCIMIGSTLFAWFSSHKYKAKFILIAAMLLSSFALGMCAVVDVYFPHVCSQVCFVGFLLYELAVGLYYPSVGFIRSLIIPEDYRAGITSWLRVPMNIITCSSLFYLRHVQLDPQGIGSKPSLVDNNPAYVFSVCALALFCGAGLGFKLPSQMSQLMHS